MIGVFYISSEKHRNHAIIITEMLSKLKLFRRYFSA